MKVRLVDQIKRDDALNLARQQTTDLARFSEWHHFNFTDDRHGLYGILNLALSGNIQNGEEARGGVSLVVYDWKKGWHGTVNLYPLNDASFVAGRVDLRIGKNTVKFKDDSYQVKAAMRDRSIELNASFVPTATPVRLDNIGSRVSTFVAPRMTVEGQLSINGVDYSLKKAVGYHDHNWGYWDWGQNIGWDWGFIIQNESPKKASQASPISIVFGRVTDAHHKAKSDLVLIVWVADKFRQAYMDKAVSIQYSGELQGVRIPRIPGPMDMLDTRAPSGIPKQVKILVEEDDDSLTMVLDVEGATQFLIPHPVWKAVTTITEMVGTYTVRGRVCGHPVDFRFRGFAELAG